MCIFFPKGKVEPKNREVRSLENKGEKGIKQKRDTFFIDFDARHKPARNYLDDRINSRQKIRLLKKAAQINRGRKVGQLNEAVRACLYIALRQGDKD